MAKIAFIGDLHFNMKNYKEMSKALGVAVQACVDQKVDMIIQLGDIFDFYNVSSGRTSVSTIVHAIKEPLSLAVQNDIHVVILEGNHDASSPGLQGEFYRSSIDLLEGVGISTFTKPQIIKPIFDDREWVSICILPWLNEPDRHLLDVIKKEFVNRNQNDFGLVVGHFTTEDITLNGVSLDNTGEFVVRDLESFNANLIVSGHIHKREGVYPGILMHQNLNDVGQPTGFRIVDIKQGKIIEDYFVDIKTPRYHLIELDTAEPTEILKSIDQINDYDQYVVRIKDKKQGSVKVPDNVKLEYKPVIKTTSRLELKTEEAFKMSAIDAWMLWANRNGYSKDVVEHAVRILRQEGVK